MSAPSRVLRRRERDADPGMDLVYLPSATQIANAALSVAMDGGSKLIVGPCVKLRSADVIRCDTLVVEGVVEATINARVMQIAEGGVYIGSAEFDFAQIRGKFEGKLDVRQTLVVRATGMIAGRIRCRRLAIEEGGQFSGEINCGDALAHSGAEVKKVCATGQLVQQVCPKGRDMNKADLIAAISADTDLTKAECSRVLDAILKNLSGSLSRGEPVHLAGFGTFGVSTRAERMGRNPRSGEPLTIKASRGAKFTAAKALKDVLNSEA